MTSQERQAPQLPAVRRGYALAPVAAVAFASVLMLAMQGYQFGKSNHTVYLIDALRHASPNLLASDWFATQTLQYHAVFGWITRWLFAPGIIEPAFLLGYLALLVMLHVAWWRIVRAVGADVRVFVVSVVMFQLLAGGTALGMYQFLQDGAFLPSNIAAVAMLWGLAMWLDGRTIASGVWLGVAGLFHLNYALVAPLVWIALQLGRRPSRAWWIGSAAAVLPCIVNIACALGATRDRSGAMPLAEFVALYVKLRHPHHYDPASWPGWVWGSFIIPIAIAITAMSFRGERKRPEESGSSLHHEIPQVASAPFGMTSLVRVTGLFVLLIVLALIGAGLFYVSETLVQASLYRFSVFVKLLSCVAAALVICKLRGAAALSIGLGIVLIALCAWRGPYAGLFRIPADDPSYLRACDWIRANTDEDALFIVPPDEQAFRLRAQRAIVVNFKAVPQLSAELKEWRRRMEDVLATDVTALPQPFPATLEAMRQRYDSLDPQHLIDVAHQYGARYVLSRVRWPQHDTLRIDLDDTGWFLYDCGIQGLDSP